MADSRRHGSRITGGGFGGCTVSIVKNDAVDTFIDKRRQAPTKKKSAHEAEFYAVDIGDGARPVWTDPAKGRYLSLSQ